MNDTEPKAPTTRAALEAEIADLKRQLREANHAAAADRHRLAEIDREPQGPAAPDPLDVELEDLRRQVAQAEEETRAAAARRTSLEAEIINLRIEIAIERAAERYFAGDPDLGCKLVDRAAIRVDPETGRVEGAAEAMLQIAREYPRLAQGKRSSGGGSPAGMPTKRPGGDGAALKAREAGQWMGVDRIADGMEFM